MIHLELYIDGRLHASAKWYSEPHPSTIDKKVMEMRRRHCFAIAGHNYYILRVGVQSAINKKEPKKLGRPELSKYKEKKIVKLYKINGRLKTTARAANVSLVSARKILRKHNLLP